MSERKGHDFISVDSFSQLPFIRRQIKPPQQPPQPPPLPSKTPNIRLFGFNFPPTAADNPPIAGAADNERKFECHYCCRKFPTSQALGGHQNAHKRERQQAKRAHMYGSVGYHHLGIPAEPPTRFPFSHPAAQFYPTWAGLGSATQPIIGSPLPDMWRIPAAVAAPAAGREAGFSCTDSSSSSSTSPRKDGVSLDLHL